MKNKKQQIILDIVPLLKMPVLKNQTFSYLSDEKLPNGTLVSIHFFRKKIEGIVVGSRDDFPRLGKIELKKIETVIEKNFLFDKQLQLADFISKYYISSLGKVMKNFVPQRTKKRIEKNKKEEFPRETEKKNLSLTDEQKNILKKISQKKTKFLLFSPDGSGKTEIYIHSILSLKKKNKDFQFLFLLPEKMLTPQIALRFKEYFKDSETAFLSSNLSKGDFFLNWQKIKTGQAKVIIGTRMAVFAPFKKLGLIIVNEEQDISFKQWEMSPRYDARKIAEKLAEIHNCALIFGSSSPSIEAYFRTKNKELEILELSFLRKKYSNINFPETEIVDMRREKWKNKECLSLKLRSEIDFALKNKRQALFFINRQGMSLFSVCDSCKSTLRCPICDRALVYQKTGHYKCNHCNYVSEIFPKCKKCGGIVFKNIGLGTEKVEREIAKNFPLAKIIVADKLASQRKNFHNEIFLEFSQKKADIIVGTQMIAKGWDLPNLGLIGIIDADNLLSLPDFRSEERAFVIISQLASRVNRPNSNFPGKIILQTFQPENSLFKLALAKDYLAFYEKEIIERKFLKLPPFSRIIKIIYQDINLEKTKKESEIFYNKLTSFKFKDLQISEPHSPLLLKVRGKFRQQIILKIINKEEEFFLKEELKKLTRGWIIDVDPISIL